MLRSQLAWNYSGEVYEGCAEIQSTIPSTMVSQEIIDQLNAARLSAIRSFKAASSAVLQARATESLAEAAVASTTAAHIIAKYEQIREDQVARAAVAAAAARSRSRSRSRSTQSLPAHLQYRRPTIPSTPAGPYTPTGPFTPIPSTPAGPVHPVNPIATPAEAVPRSRTPDP